MGRRGRDQVWSGPTLSHSPRSDSQVREISQLWRSSRKSKGLSPRLKGPTPRRGACRPSGWKPAGLMSQSQKAGRKQGCALPESQHRGSSLKSTTVICEGETLPGFRVCAGGTGVCWDFLRVRDSGGYHFHHATLTLHRFLPFHPAGLWRAGTISDTLHYPC